jgi:hypothetical protein
MGETSMTTSAQDHPITGSPESEREPAAAPEIRTPDVDDVVLHTDSGSGASQAEHWPPNVDMPDDEA